MKAVCEQISGIVIHSIDNFVDEDFSGAGVHTKGIV
jgi:hypothetical protein